MSAFGRYHPVALMGYFLSVLAVAMFVANPVIQGTALLGGGLCCLLLRRGEMAADLRFYGLVLVLTTLTNPLFSHHGATPLLYINGMPVTAEALLYGLMLGVTLVGVLLWCRCYSRVMTTDKFLCLFGRVIPRTALVLSTALRFVPMLRRQLRRVERAQQAMGYYAGRSYMGRIRGAMRVLTAMIGWSFENAMQVAAAMKARGYGLPGRSRFALFRFGGADGRLLGVTAALLGVTLWGVAAGDMTFRYYPAVSGLCRSPVATAGYAAFAVLALLPAILEMKEAIRWRSAGWKT